MEKSVYRALEVADSVGGRKIIKIINGQNVHFRSI